MFHRLISKRFCRKEANTKIQVHSPQIAFYETKELNIKPQF